MKSVCCESRKVADGGRTPMQPRKPDDPHAIRVQNLSKCSLIYSKHPAFVSALILCLDETA